MINVDLTTLSGWDSLAPGTYNITVGAKSSEFDRIKQSASVSVVKEAPVGVTRLEDYSIRGNIIDGYLGNDTHIAIPASYSVAGDEIEITMANAGDLQEYCYNNGGFYFSFITNYNSEGERIIITSEYDFNNHWSEIDYHCYNGDGVFTYFNNGRLVEGNDIQITMIEHGAFQYNTSLESVIIPDTITDILQEAFKGCSSLQNITLGNNVTSLGHNVFGGCTSLRSLHIPASVQYIDSMLFTDINYSDPSQSSVAHLQSITVDPNNQYFDSRENCNAIINTATNTMIAACPNTIIPASVTGFDNDILEFGGTELVEDNIIYTGIGDNPYFIQKGVTDNTLTSYTVNSNTKIVSGFYECRNAVTINIPEGVTTIQHDAFTYCESLTGLVWPSTVKKIPRNLCYGSGLKRITIPTTVTDIGQEAFESRLIGLEIIYPGTSEQWIAINKFGDGATGPAGGGWSIVAFPYGTKINPVYNSESTCTTQGEVTYMDTYGTMHYNEALPLLNHTLDANGECAVCHNVFEGCAGTPGIVLDKVRSGGWGANQTYTGYVKNYTGSDSVVVIPRQCQIDGVFYNVTSLSSAFYGNTNITSVEVPASVDYIGNSAFRDCTNLSTVIIHATTPPYLTSILAFSNIDSNCVIYVPAESVEDYKAATNWAAYESMIQAIPE